MLEIKTGKGNLILDPSIRIRFSRTFPMFVTNAIPNTVTYSFDLPDDPDGVNRRIIGTSPSFDSARKYRNIYVVFVNDGEEIDSGVLLCSGSNNSRFRCIFYSSPFAEGFEDKELQQIKGLLNSITLGETTEEIVTKAKELSGKQYPHTDVVFPTIYAPKFYGDNNKDFKCLLNMIDNDTETYLINTITKEWETGDPEGSDYETNDNSLLPCFFLRSIMRDIFSSQKYKVLGSFFTNPRTKNDVMLAQKAADRQEYWSWIDANITGWTDIDQFRVFTYNEYQHGVSLDFYQNRDAVTSQKGYYEITIDNLSVEYVQDLRILYLTIDFNNQEKTEQITIEKSDNVITGITHYARFWHDGSQQKSIRIRCNQNYKPLSGTVTIRGTSINTLNRYAKSVSIGEYFSGTPVSKMINAIRQLFGLVMFIDKQRMAIQIDMAYDVIASSTAVDISKWVISKPEKEYPNKKKYTIAYDWSDTELMTPIKENSQIVTVDTCDKLPKPLKTSVAKILSLYRYFITEKNTDGSYKWVESVTFLKDVLTGGTDSEEYKPELQSLISYHTGTKSNLWYTKTVFPYLPGEGKSDCFGNNNEIKLTVLNYLGFIASDNEGVKYPYATIGNKNNLGVADNTIQSLIMEGDSGLYKKVLKPMLDIVGNHDVITLDIQPCTESLHTLLNIFRPTIEGESQPARKVAINGVDAWVKQLDFEITLNGIVSIQTKLAIENYEC